MKSDNKFKNLFWNTGKSLLQAIVSVVRRLSRTVLQIFSSVMLKRPCSVGTLEVSRTLINAIAFVNLRKHALKLRKQALACVFTLLTIVNSIAGNGLIWSTGKILKIEDAQTQGTSWH